MVQFTKLRLTGFKSFVEQTELLIEPGITGIVGPNGCGKSNLVEALRWVMGETSAKRMRGSEMDDVIFGGNSNRPPRNVADVVLTLDNAARKVPAQFNDFDELEIERRIERGSGSVYRVNGREARARDVQLLFADAATGAHSTALVSQGRVGAIINAKPTDRRSLLEEAAGITGLHSRRHEAELRLRAAEANLARLDDVIVTLESQLQALKKQARQATRYRNINDHVRRAEAVLLHLQWLEAAAATETTATALTAAEAQVTALTATAAAAATEQGEAAVALPELRRTEAEAAAELQRLNLAREGLDQEEARVEAARAEASRRLAQIDDDIRRETALAADAAAAQARLESEQEDLTEAAMREKSAAEEAVEAVAAAQAAVEACEGELTELTQEVATGEARQTALARRIADLENRLMRLRQRSAEIAEERSRLEAAAQDDSTLALARDALDTAEAELERAQAEASAAEEMRQSAAAAEATARDSLQTAQTARQKLTAEVEALAALFAATDSDLWPPLIDSLSVAPGYEAALGAALGDDLTASTDAGAPVHWLVPPEDSSAPALPAGAEPLSRHVRGSAALARRLSQIGLVPDEAAGRALASTLAQGQRLVTADGAMWRWDGYTVVAGTPTAAVTRMQQRNRLQELRGELEMASAAHAEEEARFAEVRSAAATAADREQAARQAVQAAYGGANKAREAFAGAERAAAAANSRLTALDETAASVAADLAEAEDDSATAREDQASLPDLAAAQARVALLRPQLAERRAELIECRSADDRLRREAEMRRRRLDAIAQERSSWAERAAAAMRQLEVFATRRAELDEDLQRLAGRPDEISEQRRALVEHIEAAKAKRRDAADRLAEAETRLTEADRRLRQEEARLAEAREDRVRAEAAVAQASQTTSILTERIRERLDCAPDEVAAIAELAADATLPDRQAAETRLQRLLRERDAIGPVNLRAETEAAELEQQITGLQSERSDLIAAISRLRQGIASLNREGRERLLAAFELVNGHFEQLFMHLFGGGRAHLKLTEAEDPLEAGLEIMASPPGKRLQVMSLLSGGEQALTALSLLFAVFQTNPAPICVLDEVDAPLDDANVDRFCSLVEQLAHSTATRFLVITHHRMTMARVDRLFGVTMGERGVSQLVSVDLQGAIQIRASA
ncbi:AAA family ATPase [Rhodospirillaceae bacterium SYSU D60014]|uniref:chromosome segregation SMC family protein n=1 Tax=Virgifigura deserti TaxID=2268457 RepID=UPI000E67383A